MPRRPVMTIGVATIAGLTLSVPAVARSVHQFKSEHLVMKGHVLRGRYHGSRLLDLVLADPSSTFVSQGFACETIVGQGPTDSTYLTHWTYDSSEFYIRFDVKGHVRYSVTTNCVGQLPSGTTVSTSPVSHVTANCGQIDPFNPSKFIVGWGLTTTYPDGMYSETCNTPAFKK